MFFSSNPIELIRKSLLSTIKEVLVKNKIFDLDLNALQLSKSKSIKFGNYSTNFLLKLPLEKQKIFDIAQDIIRNLNKKIFKKAEFIKPGFLNLWIEDQFYKKTIYDINNAKEKYGYSKSKNLFYNLEFISANPTGLLHIGHARNAAIGDSLARIWKANGIKVNREYYINDAGNQIKKLGMSTLLRYRQLFDKKDNLPEDSYHGKEIIDIAQELKNKYGDKFLKLEWNENEILNDKNKFVESFAKNYMLNIIKETLKKFNVEMDIWFSETDLYVKNIIKHTLKEISKFTYKKDDAIWLKTTEFGDDKDRVLVKSNKDYTYFLPDIAYHMVKFSRGYDKCFNIWGSDHMSYAERMKIAIQMLGYKPEQLVVLIMQMVRLVKNGQEFKMSKRTGNSLTLEDIVELIGVGPSRWFLVSSPISSHLEIDVDKVKERSSTNSYFYVQYAHARINQIINKAKDKATLPISLDLLNSDIELEIIDQLNYFMQTIEIVSCSYEINKLNIYLYNLAKIFHSYYSSVKIIDESNEELIRQRLFLLSSIKWIIKNGLQLLGIEALDSM